METEWSTARRLSMDEVYHFIAVRAMITFY